VKRLAYTLTLGILVGFLLLVTFPVQAIPSASLNARPDACGLDGTGLSERMDRLLDSLEEKGFDVSVIRAAPGNGDTGTARTLLQQFLQQNRDALPEKPARGDNPARGLSQAGNTDSPAVNNPASTGNTTVFRTRHGKGVPTQKSTQTA